jgi:inositol 1,4,5-triphosphate receptor type 1
MEVDSSETIGSVLFTENNAEFKNESFESGHCFPNNSISCANQTNQINQTEAQERDNSSSVLLDLINKENNSEIEEKSNSEEESIKERACDSLIMCIITTLNQGLRNGGGIGDVLRSPSSVEPLFVARVIYDLLFFFIVIIIILNLIFGVIIDTFADLRSEKQQKEEILKNTCFICGNLFSIIDYSNFIHSIFIYWITYRTR